MKKLTVMMLTILSAIVPMFAQSTDSIPEHRSNKFDNENYLKQDYGDNSLFIDPNGGKPNLLILVETTDDDGLILIYNKQIPRFRNALIDVLSKFKEWEDAAVKNGVKNYTKEIPIKFPKVIVGWYFGNTLYARKGVPITFDFKIKDGNCYIESSYIVTSAKNRFIKTTYKFTIESVDELQELIDIINPDSLLEIVNQYKIDTQKLDEIFN